MRTRKKPSSTILALLLAVMMVATSLSQTVIAEEMPVNTPESAASEISETSDAAPTVEPTKVPEPTEAPVTSETPLQDPAPEPTAAPTQEESSAVSEESKAPAEKDVQVGPKARSARAEAITVTIDGTECEGSTLEEAVGKLTGGAAAVTTLKITAGNVTVDDWKYLINLTALTTFEIDSAVTSVANIPDSAPTNLFPTSIVSVTVPQTITIGSYAFMNCTKLTTANFPAVTSITAQVFGGCTALTTASFPAMTSIAAEAFIGCTALTSASFPVATEIKGYAFYGCTKLTTLKLPASPPTVGNETFTDCPATRALGYVDASGTALTGEALTAAQAAYKALADTNGKWYGWTIEAAVTNNITVTINGSTTAASGETLQAVVEANGGAAAVTELKVTAGAVTTADWNYLNSLTALTTFEIDSAVTSVANIPSKTATADSIFPKSIVTATVPQAITIGEQAFNKCAELTAVDFPAATSIGTNAFYDCSKLTDASFPEVTSIGIYTFFFCSELTNASFPKATTISDRMFAGCSKLANASFPVATKIDVYAFLGCTALTNASFPMMTDIGNNAFKDCTTLATLKLGATPPTTVGTDAFKSCPATRALGYVAADGTALTGEALTAAQAAYKAKDDGNTSDNLWYGWTAGEAVTNAITVTINGTEYEGSTLQEAIGKLQGGAAAVTSLKITAGKATEDDWNYLKELTALTTFEIDAAVTDVANIPRGLPDVSIFPPSIVTITVPQAITIGNYAFYGCSALTTANFPAVTRIEICAFLNCTALTSVSFPAVTYINLSAFSGCTALTTASFPKVKKGIELSAFKDCTKLATLKLGATPPGVGTNPSGGSAFTNCPATRALGYLAADGTALTGDALTTAQAAYKAIDDGDTTDDLWYGWTITPPAITVTIDGGTAVSGATLQAVVEANGGATTVTELKITEGEVTEDDWNYLSKLTALTSFEIDSAVTVADIPAASDGSLFPTSIISVTVPQAIAIGRSVFNSCTVFTTANFSAAKSIGVSAFYGCTALESVSFPEATSIGQYAFRTCAALKSTSFPKVTSIGVQAFESCNTLENVTFPAATSINDEAFYNCNYLKSADFPAVTSIGKSVFSDCYALATLKLGVTPPTVGTDAFAYCPATRALGYVNADGTALTGDALKAAQAAYKAFDDGDATDNLWYGWTIAPAVATHTITASAGTGGSISPSGTVTVNEGESKTFTITADSNYKISSVTVDGANQGDISTYTFDNVTGDHSISAAFVDISHTHTPVNEWSFSANKHWRNCVANDGGVLDYAVHTFTDWVTDRAATATEKGSRHRDCTVCAYRATEDIPATGETPAKPTITAGAGSSHEISGGKDLTVTCSGELEDLTGIYVDGKLVDESNYTLKSGSTVLTLKASYLDTLSVGTHTLKFQYKDNISAETTFTVEKKVSPTPAPTVKPTEKPASPTTGDTSNVMLLIILMVTASLAILCVWVLKKRGKHSA